MSNGHLRVVIILLALAVAGVSIWTFLGLKVELIPDISFPFTTVVTVYPQATPDAVVKEVTAPIEKFILATWYRQGLKHVTSTSSAGLSVVMAEFEYGTDMTAVGNSLDEGIGKLDLPQAVVDFPQLTGMDTKNPQIIPINLNILPLMNLSLSLAHRKWPKYIDCRPIYLEQSLRDSGYEIRKKEKAKLFGLPLEIVVAIKERCATEQSGAI